MQRAENEVKELKALGLVEAIYVSGHMVQVERRQGSGLQLLVVVVVLLLLAMSHTARGTRIEESVVSGLGAGGAEQTAVIGQLAGVQIGHAIQSHSHLE